MTNCSPSPVLQQRVSHCKRKRGHSHLLAWGGWKETLQAPQRLGHFMVSPPPKGPGSGHVAGSSPSLSSHPTATLGRGAPHSSPLLLRALLLGTPAA